MNRGLAVQDQPIQVPSDVLVVGGGPVGLFTAISCRQKGLTVSVIEQRAGDVDKACGEGLMPGGVELLQRAGVPLPSGYPFRGIRLTSAPERAEAAFTDGVGYGVRRTELSRVLRARAVEVGVELHSGVRVSGVQARGEQASGEQACGVQSSREQASGEQACGVQSSREQASGAGELQDGAARESSRRTQLFTASHGVWSAKTIVAADGLHSPIRRALGLAATGRRRGRFRYGMRAHFACAPFSPFVEVEFVPEGEIYVTPISEHTVGVALLGERPLDLRSALQRSRFKGLYRARQVTRARGAGPLWQQTKRRVARNIALVGDAAGYIDAITGEGLSLGFACGQALATRIVEGRLAAYENDYRRLSRNYRFTTRGMLALSAHPAARRRILRAFSARPAALTRLLAINDGQAPLRSFPLTSLLAGLVVPSSVSASSGGEISP